MNDFFMLTAFAGLAAAISAGWMNLRTGRIVYWTGAAVTSSSVFLMAYPPDWKSGLAMAVFAACFITAVAYVNTEFITIGGRTYSLYAELDAEDDYGGGLTAKKAWWLFTLGIAIFIAFGVLSYVDEGRYWISAAVAATIVLIALSFGYRDAIMIKPVAAGQRIQLALISVMSAGIFFVVYLCGYQASKRWIVPRQAYGRHQRKTP